MRRSRISQKKFWSLAHGFDVWNAGYVATTETTAQSFSCLLEGYVGFAVRRIRTARHTLTMTISVRIMLETSAFSAEKNI